MESALGACFKQVSDLIQVCARDKVYLLVGANARISEMSWIQAGLNIVASFVIIINWAISISRQAVKVVSVEVLNVIEFPISFRGNGPECRVSVIEKNTWQF